MATSARITHQEPRPQYGSRERARPEAPTDAPGDTGIREPIYVGRRGRQRPTLPANPAVPLVYQHLQEVHNTLESETMEAWEVVLPVSPRSPALPSEPRETTSYVCSASPPTIREGRGESTV